MYTWTSVTRYSLFEDPHPTHPYIFLDEGSILDFLSPFGRPLYKESTLLVATHSYRTDQIFVLFALLIDIQVTVFF